VRLTEGRERKESSSSDDTILEALGMAEGLAEKVDLILTKLSKLDKLDDIELRLNNLSTSVSSIEMSMSHLEKEVSVLDSKTKTIDKSVDELKESLCFCEDDISDLMKNTYDIKENCSSNTEELRKQILYLETYSRREDLKFVGHFTKKTASILSYIFSSNPHSCFTIAATGGNTGLRFRN
jgi:septal ring factor EnvC (AmiA/AmiB activator)